MYECVLQYITLKFLGKTPTQMKIDCATNESDLTTFFEFTSYLFKIFSDISYNEDNFLQ